MVLIFVDRVCLKRFVLVLLVFVDGGYFSAGSLSAHILFAKFALSNIRILSANLFFSPAEVAFSRTCIFLCNH